MSKKLSDEEKDHKKLVKYSEAMWKKFVAESDEWDRDSYVRWIVKKLYDAEAKNV